MSAEGDVCARWTAIPNLKNERGDEKMDQAFRTYLEQTESLYASIEEWLAPTGVQTSREEVEMLEEDFGAYTAPAMTIKNGGGRAIARMTPVGASIIGGDGRVDLVGDLDRQIFIFVKEGGPALAGAEEEGERKSFRLYRGADKEGWYWIEDSRRGKAHPVERELFFELVTEVSDYEIE